MKGVLKGVIYFLFGFFLMAVLDILTQCNRDENFMKNSIAGKELKQDLDKKGAKLAIDRFREGIASADTAVFNEYLISDCKEHYAATNFAYTSEELEIIGSALKKGKITSITPNFSEYTYKIDGREFILTLALDDDGEWKISNF